LPMFLPKTIVAKGTVMVAASDVIARAAIDPRKNMWLQNTAAIERRVAAIPYVATVHLERAWSGIETIVVTERAPYASVVGPETSLLVDRDLRVLANPADPTTLPELRATVAGPQNAGAFLSDQGVKALRDNLDELDDAHLLVRSLEHDKYGDLVVVLRNGVRVLFGDESDVAKKIPLVNPILSQVGRAGRPIATIDLRAVGTPVVVYKK
jgi:cell division septal protein FtsQ